MQAVHSIAETGRSPEARVTETAVIAHSSQIQEVLRQAKIVAPTESTVLIHGETGTGKELIAQAIHRWSGRDARRLVKVNVAAIPSTLLESELFGNEKGAFTGAVARRVGRLEWAEGGTLFLDEIGELPLELQPKLLRLLQEREYERLGSNHTMRSDARLVVATHRDLAEMVSVHSFREDLYYRLNVFPLYVPPLRERRDDIPPLTRSFVEACARKMGKSVPLISAATMASLASYSWPGNIRQLQNVIERAVILATDGELQIHLPPLRSACTPLVTQPTPVPVRTGGTPKNPVASLDDVQRAHILGVLEATDWVVGGPRGAAAKLGMKRSTLNYRLEKLGILRRSRCTLTDHEGVLT